MHFDIYWADLKIGSAVENALLRGIDEECRDGDTPTYGCELDTLLW